MGPNFAYSRLVLAQFHAVILTGDEVGQKQAAAHRIFHVEARKCADEKCIFEHLRVCTFTPQNA